MRTLKQFKGHGWNPRQGNRESPWAGILAPGETKLARQDRISQLRKSSLKEHKWQLNEVETTPPCEAIREA